MRHGRAHRGKASAETSARALPGTWQPEHLCALPQSLALYDYDHQQSRAGDQVIAAPLQGMECPEVPPLAPKRRVRRRQDNAPTFDARPRRHQVAGGDWTVMEGIEESTALVV